MSNKKHVNRILATKVPLSSRNETGNRELSQLEFLRTSQPSPISFNSKPNSLPFSNETAVEKFKEDLVVSLENQADYLKTLKELHQTLGELFLSQVLDKDTESKCSRNKDILELKEITMTQCLEVMSDTEQCYAECQQQSHQLKGHGSRLNIEHDLDELRNTLQSSQVLLNRITRKVKTYQHKRKRTFSVNCYYCNKEGHQVKHCRIRQRDMTNKAD